VFTFLHESCKDRMVEGQPRVSWDKFQSARVDINDEVLTVLM
jgi:hypothetical protein